MSRRWIRFVTMGLLLAVAAGARAQAPSLDDLVLASINGEQIKRRDLVQRLIEYRGEDALEKAVRRSLVEQEARRLKLSVTEAEVEQKLRKVRSRFGNDETYRSFLERSRLTERQLREETSQTLLLTKVALHHHPIRAEDLEQYDVRLAAAPDQATASKWIQDMKGGTTFEAIAAERSIDATLRRARGKLRPFIRIEMLDLWKIIDEQKLKVGEVTSKPAQLGEHWVLMRLERRLSADLIASAAERERLETLMQAYQMDQWLGQAREKAKVEKKPWSEAVVATVDGEPIRRDEVVARLLDFHGEEALGQMVNRTLLLQNAKQLALSVSEMEADQAFEQVKQQVGGPVELQALFAQSGLTERQLRDEVRYNTLMERVALKSSPVVDEDLQQYDIRMIVVSALTQAESLVKALDNGEDFGTLALTYSIDPQGRQAAGRMRPFVRIDMLDIWRAIDEQKLKPGGYTKKPVLLSDNTFALVKLENIIPVSEVSADERKKLEARVRSYRVDQWLTQARANAKIAYPVPLSTALGREK